jgi:hypothetical protein
VPASYFGDFPTGNSRNLALHIAGNLFAQWNGHVGAGGDSRGIVIDDSMSTYLWVLADFDWDIRIAAIGAAIVHEDDVPNPPVITLERFIRASASIDSQQFNVHRSSALIPIDGSVGYEIDISVPVQQRMEISEEHVVTNLALPGEGPAATRIRFYEMVVPGTISFSIKIGGVTAIEGTAPVPTGWVNFPTYQVQAALSYKYGGLSGDACAISGAITLGKGTIAYPNTSVSSDGLFVGSTDNGVSLVIHTLPDTGFFYDSNTPPEKHWAPVGAAPWDAPVDIAGNPVYLSAGPMRPVKAVCDLLLCDGSEYPDDAEVDFHSSAGLAPTRFVVPGESPVINVYDCATSKCLDSILNDSPGLFAYAQMVGTALSANGDDPRDSRCMAYGQVWPNALILTHDPTKSVEDCTNASAWSIDHGTVVATSGELQFHAAGNVAKATRQIPDPGMPLQSHRFLRFDIALQGAANADLQFLLNDKAFSLNSGPDNVYQTVTIDMCCPSSDPVAPRDMDTLWPLDHATAFPLNEAYNTGVNMLKTIAVASIPDGATLKLRPAAAIVLESVLLDILASFQAFVPRWGPSFPLDFAKRLFMGMVDGRVSFEATDTYLHKGISPSPDTIIAFSIQELADQINSTPGWHATVGTATQLVLGHMPAYWLGGAGVIVQGDPDIWLQKPVPASVPAQLLFDIMICHPGCHDMYSGAGYDSADPISFRFTKILRGTAHGLAVDASDIVVEGAQPVLLEQPTQEPRGSGVSNDLGYYATGAPGARGTKTHKIHAAADSPPFVAFTRRKTRAIALVGVPRSAHLCVEPSGLFHCAIVKSDGIHTSSFDNRGYISTHKIVNDPNIGEAKIAFSPLGSGHLAIVYTLNTTPTETQPTWDIYYTESPDHAKNWATPLRLFSGYSDLGFDIDVLTGLMYLAGSSAAELRMFRRKPDEAGWSNIGAIPLDRTVLALRCDASVDKAVLAYGKLGDGFAVYRAAGPDLGAHWTKDSGLTAALDFIAGDRAFDTGIDYCIGHDGDVVQAYSKAAPGTVWQHIGTVAPWDAAPMGLRASPASDGRLFATGRIGTSIQVYSAVNSGADWTLEFEI